MSTMQVERVGTARLEIRGASKTFGSKAVLRDVSLSIMPGEVHGVVGQNGSGKSTLAKIVSGYHAPDSGTELLVDGAGLRLPVRLKDLHQSGVSIVYQDLGLLAHEHVVANVRIGAVRGTPLARRVNWRSEGALARASLARLGFKGSLSGSIEHLTPADRARVAIARALQERQPGRGLIIFDESTRALPEDALADFYATIRSLTGEGTSVLIIGHRLTEILDHCDRVSVLRDGQCVASSLPTSGLAESKLAAIMLGRDLAAIDVEAGGVGAASAVRAAGVQGPGLRQPLDLAVAKGEVVGLCGLPGSGYEAAPYLFSGASPASSGRLTVGQDVIDLATSTIGSLARAGVVLVPEGRLNDGLCSDHSVRENIAVPWVGLYGRRWTTGRRWQEREAMKVINDFNVVPRDIEARLGSLSGGNQQKVLLGEWLVGDPKLLLLHEPTQAVDVHARREILEVIHRVARRGTSVLLASSEAPDLALICDRILIFRDGLVEHELVGPCDPNQLLDLIYRREPTMSSESNSTLSAPADVVDEVAPSLPAPDPPGTSPGMRAVRWVSSSGLLLIIWALVVVVFALIEPSTFLQTGTFRTISNTPVQLIFLALALVITFSVGEFDLSVAAVMGIGGTLVAFLNVNHGVNPWVATLIALLVGAAVGLANGLLVVVLEVDPIVVTLGLGTFVTGVALWITDLNVVNGLPSSFSDVANHPVGGVSGLVRLRAHPDPGARLPSQGDTLGLRMSFVGANREVARLAGIRVGRIRVGAYVASGLISSLGGVILAATLGGFNPSSSPNYLLPAFAAVFLGTAVIQPGKFNPIGAFVGSSSSRPASSVSSSWA